MKFDVNKIQVIDLNGDIQPVEVGKALGNAIYSYARTIEWDAHAKAIHKSKAVELSEIELREIMQLIAQRYVPLLLMVKMAIITYIQELLTTKDK